MPSIRDRCPTCGFDPATVSPSDVVVAARSFPRRYRALLVRPDDEDGAELVRRRPPEGLSALEHAAMAAEAMSAAALGVRRAAVEAEPTVSLAVPEPGPQASVDAVLARLSDGAESLAGAVEGFPGDEWHRPVHVSGESGRVAAADLARAGVHAGVHHLRQAERVIEAVRGRF
jgi:hypothetical protein